MGNFRNEQFQSEVAPSHRPKLLIFDDRFLEDRGEVYLLLNGRFGSQVALESCSSLESVCAAADQMKYDMLIFHINGSTPKEDLASTFDVLSRNSPDTRIVAVAEQEPEPPVPFLKRSLYQYVPYPLDVNLLFGVVADALEKESSAPVTLRVPEASAVMEFEGMIGISLPMRRVFEQITDAAATDIPVLITGETGTGKDLVAAAIHNRSKRSTKPYVPVNTGAIAPELIASELFGHEKGAYTGALERRHGLFEQAHGGTIFLDEISTMDERTQVGLLRILETKTFRRVRGDKDIQVDVRVVAATNESLDRAIRERRFREDLYYRLDVFHIQVPPLRERPGGAIAVLTNYFVLKYNEVYSKAIKSVAPESFRALRRYRWPGNVRELKHVVQRAVLMSRGEQLTPDLLPERIIQNASVAEASSSKQESSIDRTAEPQSDGRIQSGLTLENLEKQYIALTLAEVKGNKKQAALQLGISRRALYNKLQKYSLS